MTNLNFILFHLFLIIVDNSLFDNNDTNKKQNKLLYYKQIIYELSFFIYPLLLKEQVILSKKYRLIIYLNVNKSVTLSFKKSTYRNEANTYLKRIIFNFSTDKIIIL